MSHDLTAEHVVETARQANLTQRHKVRLEELEGVLREHVSKLDSKTKKNLRHVRFMVVRTKSKKRLVVATESLGDAPKVTEQIDKIEAQITYTKKSRKAHKVKASEFWVRTSATRK